MSFINKIVEEKFFVLNIELGQIPEECHCYGYIFKKEAKSLSLTENIEPQKFGEILKNIPKHSPIIIHLKGKQILTRIEKEKDKSLFTEIDSSEFYLSRQCTSSWTVESIIRKENVDSIIEYIKIESHLLLSVSFGPVNLMHLEEFLDNGSYISDNFGIEISESRIISIKKSPENEKVIELEGIRLPEKDLILLATLLTYLQNETIGSPDLSHNISQYQFFKKNRILLPSILSFFLVLLLMNFFLYSHYNKQLVLSQNQSQLSSSKIEQIHQLENQLAEFNSVFSKQANSIDENLSKILDQIALNRPSGIWFTKLEINPLQKKTLAGQQMQIESDIINLQGETSGPVELNRFMDSLKNLDWVLDIELAGYNKSNEDIGSEFEIKIIK